MNKLKKIKIKKVISSFTYSLIKFSSFGRAYDITPTLLLNYLACIYIHDLKMCTMVDLYFFFISGRF